MEEIKVTIVTVCYNSSKTIEQTIKSVLGQSYKNIEYIIIDGGSNDGTVEIIKRYGKSIAYWVSESDRGIYDAMNKGIDKATGDIIAFINSDDWYAEGAIAAMVQSFLRWEDADIICGSWHMVHPCGLQTLVRHGNLDNICFGMICGHPATFVKTVHMKQHPFDVSYRIAADYAFLLEMYLQGKKFYFINDEIAYFRCGGLSGHPWKTYIETRKIALNLTRSRVSAKKYQYIRKHFSERRVLPLFRYICKKIGKSSGIKRRQLLNHLRSKKFVLYGAGEMGRDVLEALKDWNLTVISFWDSDSSKDGTKLNGVPILYPRRYTLLGDDVIILIATVVGGSEISENLKSLGYKHGKDFYDKEKWVGWLAKEWLLIP
jgi:glycosyltransferase involved in cell wall biosynthesis